MKNSLKEQMPNTKNFKKSDVEDIEVLDNIKKGNSRAFAHIVHKYREFLYIKIVHAVKDEDFAQDVLQDIFQKVYLNIFKYEKRYTFNSWLTRVAENHIVDVIRKRKKNKNMFETTNYVELDAAFGNGLNYEDGPVRELADEYAHIFDKESYEDMHTAAYNRLEKLISQLNSQDQAILRLFFLEKKRQNQIASILGLGHVTVRVRINRIKKHILTLSNRENSEVVS